MIPKQFIYFSLADNRSAKAKVDQTIYKLTTHMPSCKGNKKVYGLQVISYQPVKKIILLRPCRLAMTTLQDLGLKPPLGREFMPSLESGL